MQIIKLIFVDIEKNHNKIYLMEQIDNDTFKASWGREGNENLPSKIFQMYEWDKKMNSKIKKGYKDVTFTIGEKVSATDDEFSDEDKKERFYYLKNKEIKNILNRLLNFTNEFMNETYKIKKQDVTEEQIKRTSEAINKIKVKFENIDSLSAADKKEVIKEANVYLLDIFSIVPRKMKKVEYHVFRDDFEIEKIEELISSEEEKLQSLNDIFEQLEKEKELKLKQKDKKSKNKKDLTEEEQQMKLLEELGITLKETSSSDVDIIKNKLGNESYLYKNSWIVINEKTDNDFTELKKEAKFKNSIELFWHGSRNQNWYNIIQTGLDPNPKNVIVTGKMFGYGTYFAPKAKKSLGYTSLENSYWSRGNSKTAFMALYEVSLGDVHHVKRHESWLSRTNKKDLYDRTKKDSVFAHASNGFLRNDEIIVYQKQQMNIRYLVELEKK